MFKNNILISSLTIAVFTACGGGGTSSDSNNSIEPENVKVDIGFNEDSDGDYIPDNIESLLGMNSNNSDENDNGILDGLESNGPFGDNYFSKEWHIYARGTTVNESNVSTIKGNDLNLLPVYHRFMGYNKGKPIQIQVVDLGVDINHEDLKDNLILPESLGDSSSHGTKIAGIVAARAFNGKGVRGIAPFAKVSVRDWLSSQDMVKLENVWLSSTDIVVSNNSWGSYYNSDTMYEKIMKKAQLLRSGKGRSFVFAGGNDRSYKGDTNLQYIENNRFAITVAALDVDDTYAPYSTAGANVFISAYGGSSSVFDGATIVTTTLSGKSKNAYKSDKAKRYTYGMSGTSAAAPMVSGAIALINEACPKLTSRDIKYVIAKSAKVVDIKNSSWITNAQGINFSRDYGFGKIDTHKAIELCESGYNILTKEISFQKSLDLNDSIANSATKEIEIDFNKDISIEQVELTVDIDSKYSSSYDIVLKSPSGTTIKMINSGALCGNNVFIPSCSWMNGGFRFTTPAFLDENSKGKWIVKIVDAEDDDVDGTVKSLNLKIYGHRS